MTSAAQAVAAPGAAARTHGDMLVMTVGAAVVLLPFLAPAGPGNTAPADLAIAASVVVALLWTIRDRVTVKLPYAAGVVLLVLGGALAATVSHAPLTVALVLAQDLFLLAWAATLALGRHNPGIIDAATHAWCRTAPVYATVGVMAYVVGFDPLSGVSAKDGVRASYTFGDPNLAGNYLVVSLFLMAACKRPRSPGVRRAGYVAVLLALAFTGSNGGMFTLVVGTGLCLVVSRFRSGGSLDGTLTLGLAALVTVTMLFVVMPRVDLTALRAEAASSVPLLRDSFGRSGSSTSERATIVEEGYHLFLEGDATGYGPARTKANLAASQAPYVKEAHNDYLATLLERGVLGAVGLLVLALGLGGRCIRLVTGTLPDRYAAVVPRAWLLVVIAPVMASSAAFYEVLHFRHLWTWLGIVAALVLVLQDQQDQPVRQGKRP